MAILLTFLLLSFNDWKLDHKNSYLIQINTFLLGMIVISATYYFKMGYDQLHNQYDLMLNTYRHAKKRLEPLLGTPADKLSDHSTEIKQILEQTGKEALIEIGSWYMIYKEKEPEIEGFN